MRIFTLINGDGIEYSITETGTLFHDIGGLGYSRDEEYRTVGDRRILVSRETSADPISGSIAFYGDNPYDQYYQFYLFTCVEPLTLTYDCRGILYKREVSITSIEKADLLPEGGYLDCAINFVPLTPWYRTITVVTIPEGGTGEGTLWPQSADEFKVAVSFSSSTIKSIDVDYNLFGNFREGHAQLNFTYNGTTWEVYELQSTVSDLSSCGLYLSFNTSSGAPSSGDEIVVNVHPTAPETIPISDPNFWVPAFRWRSASNMNIIIDSDSYMNSPTKLVIDGPSGENDPPIQDPSWTHYVNGAAFSTGRLTGVNVSYGQHLVIACDEKSYYMRVYNSDYTSIVRDVYQNSDFTTNRFIFLQHGKNQIHVVLQGGEQVTIKMEADLYYDTV